jgi:UDP:flavonoid glycosyltransferase YjiC (YdhE family)
MSRFLFVVPALVGHINPTVGVATALVERGHEVAWAGREDLIRQLAGPDVTIFPCATPLGGQARTADLKGPAAFQFLWEDYLIPLADAMAPGVRAAIGSFAPDVVVADQQAAAGGLIADSLGMRWVTSATTSAMLVDPLAGMPKVTAWLDVLLAELRGRIAGGRGTANPQLSPYGVLAFTTRGLLGPVDLPPQVWLVGPSAESRPATEDFPWDWLDPAIPAVLVTLGTTNADASGAFLAAAAEAVSGMGVRAVIVDPAGELGEVGPNVLVRRHVPQLRLLERVAAVVCHAGHNTVCEALWQGVPLVVAPIRDDQPIVAGQVADAGAGVRLRFGRADAPRIAGAIGTVLTDPAYQAAAERIGRTFRAAGGSVAAAQRLETLACR